MRDGSRKDAETQEDGSRKGAKAQRGGARNDPTTPRGLKKRCTNLCGLAAWLEFSLLTVLVGFIGSGCGDTVETDSARIETGEAFLAVANVSFDFQTGTFGDRPERTKRRPLRFERRRRHVGSRTSA